MNILAIIDPQYAFINGVLGSKEAEIAAENIAEYLRNYNKPNTLALATKDTHYKNYLDTLEGKKLPIPHCIEFTPGWSIYKPISQELDCSRKFYSYSAADIRMGRILKNTFGSERLIEVLKEIQEDVGIESITFMGLDTDICVISNVLMTKTALPETPIYVVANCCAGTTPEAHEAALTVMRSCQIEII